MTALAQSAPGAIAVNASILVGWKTAGVPGMFAATIGLVTPSVIIILIVAQFLKRFAENKYVLNAFYGLRAASVGLIAAACFLVVKIALLDLEAFEVSRAVTDLFRWKAILLAAVLYAAMKKFSFHPVVFLAASAVVGVVFRFAGV